MMTPLILNERTSLLDSAVNNNNNDGRLLKRPFNWRQAFIPLFFLIPFILWIGVIQNWDTNTNSGTPIILQTENASVTNHQNLTVNESTQSNTSISKYKLVITSGNRSPDNFLQETYLINGQFPGPTIRIKQNATLVVEVFNQLKTKAITIHFHGLHQRGSYLNDGVPGVTQEPILPGTNYTYKVNTWPQTGTFFYHAHTGMDIASLFGAIIIEDTPEIYKTWPEVYQYNSEKIFLLSGIYHEDLDQIIEDIVGPVHNYPRNVESIAVNGKSYGVWNDGAKSNQRPAPGYEVISIEKNLRYRFRFINAASDSILLCNITGHSFTVIEMDGIYTNPIDTDQLLISPGQRYSIIIQMNLKPKNYEIICKHVDTYGPKNGLAILSYNSGKYPTKEIRQRNMGSEKEMLPLTRWILDDLTPNYQLKQQDVYEVPSDFDQEFMIDVEEIFNGTRNYYVINGHQFVDPELSYYLQLGQKLNISDPPQVFEIKAGQIIQFIFQNRLRGSGNTSVCFSHPWHIHGHTFWVVGEGWDLYDPVKDGDQIKEDTRPGTNKAFQFRDTVTLFANQSESLVDRDGMNAPCGWTVVRFKANNPGLWFSHCHVTPHLIMGKKFIIWEHDDADPFLEAFK